MKKFNFFIIRRYVILTHMSLYCNWQLGNLETQCDTDTYLCSLHPLRVCIFWVLEVLYKSTQWNKAFVWLCSEFAFVSACWLRNVMDNDFMNLSKYFNAEKSIVRVPDLDPKYKIAVFASKQVLSLFILHSSRIRKWFHN